MYIRLRMHVCYKSILLRTSTHHSTILVVIMSAEFEDDSFVSACDEVPPIRMPDVRHVVAHISNTKAEIAKYVKLLQ